MGSKKTGNTFNRKLLTVAVLSCFSSHLALAAPTGASVASGAASITTSGSTMTVTNTPNAIINWASFGIAAGETVRFAQQSAASAVLNRVTGSDPSHILGALQSNGKVFLINPNGIMFGAGAQINVNGLVASTLNLSDADFLAGRINFNADRANPGSVVNAGQITTPTGGFVYLLAPSVENSGVITTPSGEAILAAGNSVEIVNSTDPSQRVLVSATSKDVNLSQLMTQSNGNIFSVLNSGKISANTAVQDATGKIYFKSTGNITTTATSVIEAKGNINANGGSFIGFADNSGVYAGSFDVSGKNGGFVETSGRTLNVDQVSINMGALDQNGLDGSWLLDPIEFSINSGNVGAIVSALSSGSVYIETQAGAYPGGTTPTGGTSGNIYIDTTIAGFSYGGTHTLTLNAYGNILFSDGAWINATGDSGTLDVNFEAGYGGGVGGIYFGLNSGLIIDGAAALVTDSGPIHMADSGSYIKAASVSATINNNQSHADAYLIVDTPQFSINTYGAGSSTAGQIYARSLYGGAPFAASNITLNAPGEWVSLEIMNQSSFSTNALNGTSVAQNFDLWTPGDLSVGSLPGGMKNVYLMAGNDLTVDAPINIAGGPSDYEVWLGLWGGNNVTFSNVANSITLSNSYGSAGLWIDSGNSTVVGAPLNVSSNYAGGYAWVDITSYYSLDVQRPITVTSSSGWADAYVAADYFTIISGAGAVTASAGAGYDGGIWIESWNSVLLDSAQIQAINGNVEIISQNTQILNGTTINGNYIGLNYEPEFIQTNAAEFFDWNSTATLTIDNSTISATYGAGFAANDVYIQNGASISADMMHGIAMNDLKLDGANLLAGSEMLLEMGGYLYLDNNSHINVTSPATLYFNFPLIASDGWYVDGVANAFSGGTGSYIEVNGATPVLGSNFFVTYGGLSLIEGTLGLIDGGLDDPGVSVLVDDSVVADAPTADEFFGTDDSGSSTSGNGGSSEEEQKKEDKPQQCSA